MNTVIWLLFILGGISCGIMGGVSLNSFLRTNSKQNQESEFRNKAKLLSSGTISPELFPSASQVQQTQLLITEREVIETKNAEVLSQKANQDELFRKESERIVVQLNQEAEKLDRIHTDKKNTILINSETNTKLENEIASELEILNNLEIDPNVADYDTLIELRARLITQTTTPESLR